MPDRKILITGASERPRLGPGPRLCRARRDLVLWGRDAARLEETAAACRAQGAAIHDRELSICVTPTG